MTSSNKARNSSLRLSWYIRTRVLDHIKKHRNNRNIEGNEWQRNVSIVIQVVMVQKARIGGIRNENKD
jgi:hypothetical protein